RRQNSPIMLCSTCSSNEHTRPSHIFFCVIRRPPISPLFPYTTLFRSRDRPLRLQRMSSIRVAVRHVVDDVDHARERDADRRHPLDRKSTRLNSSHVASSYAVFCLKKKQR